MKNSVFLYVEDDPLSREIMAMMMSSLGYEHLIIFEDSERFMERVEALNPTPDVYLLDVHVPPIDGFTMLRLLRDHPNFKDKHIIAITASVMNEEVTRLKHAGFSGAIGKPLDFDRFAGLLESVLGGEEVWYVGL
jgi:two-component system, cell cycle response regulator DivK